MRHLLPILMLALNGCSWYERLIDGKTMEPQYILALGQSNMCLMVPNGTGAFTEELGRTMPILNHGEPALSLNDWQPGGAPWRRVLEDTQGKQIVGILWYQGENDAFPHGWHSNYAQELIKFMDVWRARFGNVPIVYAQLSTTTWSGMDYWEEVKQQQASIVYPNSKMIRTDDIVNGGPTTGGDGIHYAPAGYQELARRFARAYEELIGTQKLGKEATDGQTRKD